MIWNPYTGCIKGELLLLRCALICPTAGLRANHAIPPTGLWCHMPGSMLLHSNTCSIWMEQRL